MPQFHMGGRDCCCIPEVLKMGKDKVPRGLRGSLTHGGKYFTSKYNKEANNKQDRETKMRRQKFSRHGQRNGAQWALWSQTSPKRPQMNNPIARGGVKVSFVPLWLRGQQSICLFSIEPQLVPTPDTKTIEKLIKGPEPIE